MTAAFGLEASAADWRRPWRRRPLAVLAMDLDGYSRMVESDDLGAARRLSALRRRVICPIVTHHLGRVFSIAGDGHMAAFPAVAAALGAAVAIQRQLEGAPDPGILAEIRLRMGISFGPVLERNGEYFGHALNVAARLEALSPPGSIYLCGNAFDAVAGNLCPAISCLGERLLKKMDSACRIYALEVASCQLDGSSIMPKANRARR